MPAPKQRVKQEERRLRRLEFFQKNKSLFDRERAMRQLRDARSQAEALESYLASLNSAYRQAADGRQKIKQLVDSAFRGRTAPEEVMRFYPTSYGRLREALS
jgi:RNA-splicing ligase RtcB